MESLRQRRTFARGSSWVLSGACLGLLSLLAASCDHKEDHQRGTTVPSPSPVDAFIERDGQAVLEAEHAHAAEGARGHRWERTSYPAAGGGVVMTAVPNTGATHDTGYVTRSPKLSFKVAFVTTGTYYVWVRGIGPTSDDDSCHAGVDGTGPATADRISGFAAALSWSRSTLDGRSATITIRSPGTHTVDLWMREDGFQVDRILITTDRSFHPEGAGPDESPGPEADDGPGPEATDDSPDPEADDTPDAEADDTPDPEADDTPDAEADDTPDEGSECTEATDCDDDDPCTDDTCGGGRCEHEERESCRDPEGECASDRDCDDLDVCTDDTCSAGECHHADNTRECDDGNACTEGDVCASGTCSGEALACDDGNPCTTEACQPDAGCQYTANTLPCDDGNACTMGDGCSAGVCQGSQLSCDDDDPCTDDSCNPELGCQFRENAAACDDGTACTTGDVCSGGVCRGSPLSCSDGNPCTDDSCDPTGGCQFVSNSLPCDDGSACTVGDTCFQGVCGGTAVACDDGNLCTSDRCDPALGCQVTPIEGSCDDGDPCTQGDSCTAGSCGGTVLGCDDGNPCTTDRCTDGGCAHEHNEAACDDGSACTDADACRDGDCTGTPVNCDDANPCTAESCDPDQGCQSVAVDGPCDDGNPCTEGDACTGGLCVGLPSSCDDSNPCTTDLCTDAGCTHENNTAPCDDGSACTEGDVCLNGACRGEGVDCDDGDPCTDDSCMGNGCEHTNNANDCDDGSACTEDDRCDAGVCGGRAVACDDGNPCTDDSCDEASGCTRSNNTEPCDDGSACTDRDVCAGGECSGAAVDCDDDNTCTTDSCDPELGCTYANNAEVCDDGDRCTEQDVCADGACTGLAAGCYEPAGTYLVDPGACISQIVDLVEFRTRARDDEYGGFFTFINTDGSVSADTRKSFVTETRDAYAFVRAYMVTGDDVYLDHAAHALDFLYEYGWDRANGGWYFSCDREGALTNIPGSAGYNNFKWSFIQHYALLGIAAMCEVTNDPVHCEWLRTGRAVLDEHMWDATPGQLGYYGRANLDFSSPSGKGFTPTGDALTTHAVLLPMMSPEPAYHDRLVELADITAYRLAASIDHPQVTVGFAESYQDDWSVNTANAQGEMGHLLKSAWVLGRAYLLAPSADYRLAASRLIHEVHDNGGWDEEAGVPYTNYNYLTGTINTAEVESWQVEQAYTGGIINWYIAEDPAEADLFLSMADQSLQFFADYFIDPVFGGGYSTTRPDGSVLNPSKGDAYKAEYHSTELFYFAYLYGNLLYQGRPVTLYYKAPPLESAQTLRLTPVEIEDELLQITAVDLDGIPLGTFDPLAREITLGAGQGGELRVTFERVD